MGIWIRPQLSLKNKSCGELSNHNVFSLLTIVCPDRLDHNEGFSAQVYIVIFYKVLIIKPKVFHLSLLEVA